MVAFDVMRMNGRVPEPDPGCAECVLAGPDSVDIVPCAYHFATQVLEIAMPDDAERFVCCCASWN